MGEKTKEGLKVKFDKRLRLEFHGARITSDAGLACRELDGAPIVRTVIGYLPLLNQARCQLLCVFFPSIPSKYKTRQILSIITD